MQNLKTLSGEIKEFLGERPDIVVTNHQNPDGDAVGSATALSGVLMQLGFRVKMIMPNDYSANLKWMSLSEEVLFYDQSEMEADQIISNANLLIHLDYNHPARSGKMERVIRESSAKKLMIDHHQQPDDFCDWRYSDTSMSSTCEMVWHFLAALEWTDLVTKDLAEALYAGIATDTGNFRFSATSPLTHRVAAQLLEKGVESQKVASRIYDSNTLSRFQLLGRMLNQMELVPELHAAIMHLSQSDLDECGFVKGDTEGFVNYGLSLQEVEVAVIILPRDDRFKMSFRSKTNFDVNQFARNYFSGGGHKNAAGGISDQNLSDTIAHLKESLHKHLDEITAYAQNP
ncbi:MAG: DHH family phosphoesterase [Croceimicrobium sp.]